jgi:hypothetical protein
MENDAQERGHRPLEPTVWEGRQEDGTIVCIVRSQPEAHAVASERQIEVWTVDEIVRVLPSVVSDVKRFFPGAVVQRTVRRDEAFARDWLSGSSLPNDPMPDLTPIELEAD